MNERFEQLLKKVKKQKHTANLMSNPPQFRYSYSIEERDLEKFAELIVQECVKVAINKNSSIINTADIAGYVAAGRLEAARMIKQHFGVKE